MSTLKQLGALSMAALLCMAFMAPFAGAADPPDTQIPCEDTCDGDATCIKACRDRAAQRAHKADAEKARKAEEAETH